MKINKIALLIISSMMLVSCGQQSNASNSSDSSTNYSIPDIAETDGLEYVLNKDGSRYIVSGIGSVTDTQIRIPNMYEGLPVISIGDHAFFGRISLAIVIISDGIVSIEDNAFEKCIGLKNIIIPDSVTSIGISVFLGCTALTSIIIPDSVTSIGRGAFSECASLKSITIPDGVTIIDSSTFSNCTSLTNITLGSGVSSIGSSAFWGCSGLESITVNVANETYYSEGNCVIEMATNTLVLGCKNSVIPNSVTSIDDSAFRECTNLTSIIIPNSVTSIGWSAFTGCSGLTSIIFPDSVTKIGYNAFSGCTNLNSATFENTSGWTATYPGSSYNLSSSELANSITAATYLTRTYCSYRWDRSDS